MTLHEGVDPLTDPDKHYLHSFVELVLLLGLPLVCAVRLADAAIAHETPRWLAYGTALLAVGAINHLYRAMPFYHSSIATPPPAETAWFYLAIALEGSVALTIYARWRATQVVDAPEFKPAKPRGHALHSACNRRGSWPCKRESTRSCSSTRLSRSVSSKVRTLQLPTPCSPI